MAVFVARRLLWTIPIVLVVVTVAFFATRAIAGDPFRHGPLAGLGSPAWIKYGDPQPEAIHNNLWRRYGLDRPWYEQYADYMRGLATGDLGPSLTYRNRSVNDIVLAQGARTVSLILLSLGVALVVGVALGVLGALRRGSAPDVAARSVASLSVSVPAFLVATMLIYVFSVRLGWFPTSGWDGWRNRVLPVLALSLVPLGWCVRLTRASMLELMQSNHVLAARARGLRANRVVVVHVLRSALVPIVSILGPLVGFLITGAFVVEAVFSIPGAGRYFVAGVLARDYPLVMGLTALLGVSMVLVNLVADVAHGALDPRVREAR
jgi:oligopeptide transport system permease protein